MLFNYTEREHTNDILCTVATAPSEQSYFYLRRPGDTDDKKYILVKFKVYFSPTETAEIIMYVCMGEQCKLYSAHNSKPYATLLKRFPVLAQSIHTPADTQVLNRVDVKLLRELVSEHFKPYILPDPDDVIKLYNWQIFHQEQLWDLKRAVGRLCPVEIHWTQLPRAMQLVANLELERYFYKGRMFNGFYVRFFDSFT